MSGTRVYIGKVAGVNKEELESICRSAGQLVDFMLKETYAFAEYANEYDAGKAIMELDGRSIKGIRIMAEYAKSKGDLDQDYFQSHPRIYVGRIPVNVTKEEIVHIFGMFGDITDILRKDDFAFIEYKTKEGAQTAIQKMHTYNLNGQRIVVEGARPKEAQVTISCPRLYIGKIGPQVKKSDLINTFGPYGEIIDILMKDDYSFIEFANIPAASRALVELNGSRVAGSKIVVEEAKPKDGDTRNIFNKVTTKQGKYGANYQEISKASTGGSSGQLKVRGRRLSPRRSISRSRSRSDQKKNFQNNRTVKI